MFRKADGDNQGYVPPSIVADLITQVFGPSALNAGELERVEQRAQTKASKGISGGEERRRRRRGTKRVGGCTGIRLFSHAFVQSQSVFLDAGRFVRFLLRACSYARARTRSSRESPFLSQPVPLFLPAGLSFVDFTEVVNDAMGQTTRWGSLQTRLDGHVGFDSIQEQVRRKSLKRGFEFNLMVVGKSGARGPKVVNSRKLIYKLNYYLYM